MDNKCVRLVPTCPGVVPLVFEFPSLKYIALYF
jgi:hypothetical protein